MNNERKVEKKKSFEKVDGFVKTVYTELISNLEHGCSKKNIVKRMKERKKRKKKKETMTRKLFAFKLSVSCSPLIFCNENNYLRNETGLKIVFNDFSHERETLDLLKTFGVL